MTAMQELAQPAPSRSLRALIRRHPLASYFTLAFAGTWIVLLPVLLGQNGIGLFDYTLPEEVAFLSFVLFSTFAGPTLAAWIVTWAAEGKAGLRRFLRRYLLWRVGIQWYLVATFGFLVLFLISVTIAMGTAPLQRLLQDPQILLTTFLPAAAIFFVLGFLGEEPGWRGFALPRLQARFGPVRGSLVLGLLHGLWHLPAFFVVGALAPFTWPLFTTFLLVALAGTFFYTWIYNHTRGSILIAVLTHAASNAASATVNQLAAAEPSLNGDWVSVAVFGVWALLLIVMTRGRLGYSPAP